MTYEEKKSIIRQLVEIMNMDKNNSLSKVAYLTRVKMRLGLDKAGFDAASQMNGLTSWQKLKNMNQLDKLQFLHMACELVEAGGSPTPQVAKYLVALQQELG
jgi:hypothetical protein